MFYTLVRRIRIVAKTGTNSRNFVCRDGGANATAADQNSALNGAVENASAYRFRVIGIVNGIGVIGALVDHFMPSIAEEFHDLLLERKSCVVGADA